MSKADFDVARKAIVGRAGERFGKTMRSASERHKAMGVMGRLSKGDDLAALADFTTVLYGDDLAEAMAICDDDATAFDALTEEIAASLGE